MEIIRLEPIFKEKIWGGEYWGISAHPNGDCIVTNTEYNGMKLSDLYCSTFLFNLQ